VADSDVYRTILAAGTVITANGQSAAIPLSRDTDPTTLDVAVNITAVSGTTPTLTVTVQRDNDADTAAYPPVAWTTGTSSAALNATGRTVVSAPAAINAATGANPHYYRVSWVVGGTTPSFTLGIYGE
jgi:hypothetical protein